MTYKIPLLAAWLLGGVATMTAALVPPPVPLTVTPGGRAGFEAVPSSQSGVLFTNLLSRDRHLTNQILLNGSGVAAGDVDGDGWCDLYFCGLDGANALYRNLGGWRFEDVTAQAGVGCPGQDSTGALLADLDGDGDLDLVVNSLGRGTRFFFNDGMARFTEPSEPLNLTRGAMSLAMADMDGDGDLDLYLTNYRLQTLRDQPKTQFSFQVLEGQPVVTSINGRPLTDREYTNRFVFRIMTSDTGGRFLHEEQGEADLLLSNDGKGGFHPVPFTEGAFLDEGGRSLEAPPFDWGLSVMFRDLNGDHAPDLYVCNDFKSPDRVWINDGRGRFRALPLAGLRHTSLSSMGVDVADLNRDGHDDLLVVDMLSVDHYRRLTQRMEFKPEHLPPGAVLTRPQYPRNTLFLGRGDGTYAELACIAGLEATEWSWTPVFIDVDLDGYEDLLVSNGFERDGMNIDALRRMELMKRERERTVEELLRLRTEFPPLHTPNQAFRNEGNLTFREQGANWGFDASGVTYGIALADLDNDGDQDVVTSNLNAPPGLYRNRSSAPRLAVRLQGRAPNTQGIGSRIRVLGAAVPQSQEMISGGRYLSGDQALRVFAAGPGPMTIEVDWQSGRRSRITNALANHLYVLVEPDDPPPALAPPPRPDPFFEPVQDWPGHRHEQRAFDDFERQPMLAHQQSRPGPGLAWVDLDEDGWEDLVIGCGAGGHLALFQNNGRGGLAPFAAHGPVLDRDVTGLVAWTPPGATRRVLAAGLSNYEDGRPDGRSVQFLATQPTTLPAGLPGQASSTGPLALGDVDGDGDLDLFVGGRALPGRWPEPADSMLFRWEKDRFGKAEDAGGRLKALGLVQGAVFSDLDQDGDPDLVLATQWGPVRVLVNEHGLLADRTAALGLERYRGWWNGVATGDFDGDGRPDIVASNWGRNHVHQRWLDHDLTLVGGDLDGNGTFETVEAYRRETGGPLWPLQPLHLARLGLPAIGAFFSTCDAYARADLSSIYGPALDQARRWEVNHLDSTLFLNRGDHFEARPLPGPAQWAPAFAVCVADFDGDTREDLFLSQNFFAVHPELSRMDAGRGLILLGDGHGGWQVVPDGESGLDLHSEQRGAALTDLDGDGRVDLAVGQNAWDTRIYRNNRGAPGLRLRLEGGTTNRDAIGASVHAVYGGQPGPVREVQAGSGYLSQNGLVTVWGGAPSRFQVRWQDGTRAEVDVPAGAREVVIRKGATLPRDPAR